MNHLIEKLKYMGALLFLVLLVIMGVNILFVGHIENTSVSQSVYAFDGFARLIGLLPLGIGIAGLYLSYLGWKDRRK